MSTRPDPQPGSVPGTTPGSAPDAAVSGDARKDSLIEYPSLFPIKVMGLKTDGLVATLTLMRLRNLILLQERRRPWVQALVTAPKGAEK